MFAGNQMRHCDLRDGEHRQGYVELVATYAAAAPGRGVDHRRRLVDGRVPRRHPHPRDARRGRARTGRSSCRTATATAPGSTAGRSSSPAIDAATPDPADGRIERDADGQPVGMLQEGASALVGRLLPEVTDDDWYEALLIAQRYLLASASPAGRTPSSATTRTAPTRCPLTCARPGTARCSATVVGALWWDRNRGLDQVPELIERRGRWHSDRFRATSVKMMLDGVAENHTAAMLEPYLGADDCAGDHTGLDFIDPAELPRFVTALDREGFQVHFHALGDRAVRNALDAVAAARAGQRSAERRHHLAHLQVVHPDDIPRFAAAVARPPTCRRCGPPTSRRWTSSRSRSSASAGPAGSIRSARCRPPARRCAAAATGRSAARTRCRHPRRREPQPAGRCGRRRQRGVLARAGLDLVTMLAAYTSGSAAVNGVEDHAGSSAPAWTPTSR